MPNVESRYELSEGSDLTEWWSVESDLKVTINASQVRQSFDTDLLQLQLTRFEES